MRVVVVVGAFVDGGDFGLVVVVGCFRAGTVVVSVPTDLPVVAVVVVSLEALVFEVAVGLPQALSATASDEMKRKASDERSLNMGIAALWLCERRILRAKGKAWTGQRSGSPRRCAPGSQHLDPTCGLSALLRDLMIRHDRTKRPSRRSGRLLR